MATTANNMIDPVQQSINNLNSQSLQQQQQQKKRRTAAERRASHRRRSSQNEIQLAQIRLQRRNSDQEEEEHGNGQENPPPPAAFSPIPEPPEPAIPAPGGEEDEIEDEIVLAELDQNGGTTDENGNGMDEELAAFMRKECLSPETVLNNSNFAAAFTPSHQRSVSDHLVHSAQSIRRRQRELSPGQIETIQKPPFSPVPQNPETPSPRQTKATRKTTLLEQMVNESTPKQQFPYREEYSPGEMSGRDSSPSTGETSIGANVAKGQTDRPNFEHCLGPNTSTSGILQLVSRFSAHRQHSDSNLWRQVQKVEGPTRRSFKLKSFWERKNTENDYGRMNNEGKSTIHKLCPLPEDAETDLSIQKKRHSAILNDEKPKREEGTVRLRAGSNVENGLPRPYSIIGTQDELARYRVAPEEWTRFQQFVQDKSAGEEKAPKGEWDDSLDIDDDRPPAQPPPRMTRRVPISPVNSTQTLGRINQKQKLQRAISNRADNYVPLTLPRKKTALKVQAQQRKKTAQMAARRKSTVKLQEVVAAIENQQHENQLNQQQIVEKLKRVGGSKSSLKQFWGAASERNRAKVAPKIVINGGKMELANATERSEKDRKRETKANSMILGMSTIWSMRQRRKKDGGGGTPRAALTNLWSGHGLAGDKLEKGAAGKQQQTHESGDLLGRLPNNMDKSAAGLQCPLSPLLAGPSPFNTSIDEFSANSSTASLFPPLQLVQSKWEDLDLWADQSVNWATKFGQQAVGLGEKDLKRQNVIYELVLTERHHCQVLVLLQCYRESLLHAQLLTNDQLKILIPDVLISLLDFHLALIRRLLERCSQQPIVDEIADILLEEFEAGQHRSQAIHAYTTFCLARESSIRHFRHLMGEGNGNKQFRRFMEFHESEHNKDRSFKDCLLLIAQRLTKYPILVEQMAKLECRSEQRETGRNAHMAVRKFAMEVDQELFRHEIDRQWNGLKKVLEKSGVAKIIHPKEGKEFSVEDLVWPMENGSRRLELFTKVFWRETLNSPEMELRLLLCDDLILFLRPKGSTNGSTNKLPPLQLFRHSEHAGVFPLQYILIRGQNPRRKSILLIQTAKLKPALFDLTFSTCNELEQFVQAVKKAKETAPNFIRMAKGELFPLDDSPYLEMRKEEENKFLAKMDEWLEEMDKLFEQRMQSEGDLEKYFENRMEFTEQIQTRLKRIPMRNDDKETLKMIEHLRKRFMDLERMRTTSLARLMEKAQRVKDANLWAIFDDLYDLGGGGKDANEGQMVAVDSGSDEPRGSDSSEERRRMPHRVPTYHGTTVDQRKKEDSGSSSASASSSNGIRRHTTVPGRRSRMGCGGSSEEEEQREKEGKAARLLLRMEPPQRREEAAQLIRENVRMRGELNRLKAKTALQEIHLTALRIKKGGMAAGGMKKLDGGGGEEEEESAAAQHAEMERMMLEKLEAKEAELERREAELKAREQQLLTTMGNSPILSTGPSNSFQQKEQQRDEAKEQEHSKYPNQQQGVRNGQQPSQNSIKISNTYCGAGPVPNSRSAENSPAQLATDRRAISQTELPRHLAVKTETKHRRK